MVTDTWEIFHAVFWFGPYSVVASTAIVYLLLADITMYECA